MVLEETRKKIDIVDTKIMKLLNERMELVVRTKNHKDQVLDDKREKEVLESVKVHSHGLLRKGFTEKMFREIMDESKKLQKENMKLIGFQGEHGAYSEMAVRKFDGNAIAIPCMEFSDVFSGVANKELDYGVVPVENTTEGQINAVNDLLIETDVNVIGEVYVPVHHCLLAPEGTDYREIKVVYSHPQALGQCRKFLERNKLEARPYYDTAGAARMIANERQQSAAAIANKLAAELYGLDIIKENIEDNSSNFTRFVVISREKSKEKWDKCSITFSTLHKAGALFSVLKLFSDAKVNLTLIGSRPIRNEAGKFAFLLDFQGSEDDEKVKKMLEEVKKHTAMFKFLGCYKEEKI